MASLNNKRRDWLLRYCCPIRNLYIKLISPTTEQLKYNTGKGHTAQCLIKTFCVAPKMSRILGVLRRTFGIVREHVGTDHLGNKYYIIPEQKTWTGNPWSAYIDSSDCWRNCRFSAVVDPIYYGTLLMYYCCLIKCVAMVWLLGLLLLLV